MDNGISFCTKKDNRCIEPELAKSRCLMYLRKPDRWKAYEAVQMMLGECTASRTCYLHCLCLGVAEGDNYQSIWFVIFGRELQLLVCITRIKDASIN